jgi:3'-5' exoribonuclease
MSRRFVYDLKDGQDLEEIYLAFNKQLRVNKNGNSYVQVDLSDRTGLITARMWNAGENVFRLFENGDYVQVQGRAQSFNGALQAIITHIEKAEPKNVDVGEFLPHTEHDVGKLTEKLRTTLRKLSNPHLKALCECFLTDDAFMRGFTTAPAGVKLHHAYIGGLLEHVVNMMDAADKLAPLYPGVDRDLLLVGVFLHDAGKVRELTYSKSFNYSDEGQLIGHLDIGVEMLNEQVRKVKDLTGEPFPQELLFRIKHMILSHHGTLEHGSPKVPMTPEAMLLHGIDSIDSKMHMVLREIKDDRTPGAAWTQYNTNLQRRFYKGGTSDDAGGWE